MPIQFEHKLAVPLGNSYQHTSLFLPVADHVARGQGGGLKPSVPPCPLAVSWVSPGFFLPTTYLYITNSRDISTPMENDL